MAGRRNLGWVFVCLVSLLVAPFGVRAGTDSVRGFIIDVSPSGSFRLDKKDLLVEPTSPALVQQATAPYGGRLLVGLEIEASGERQGDLLRADTITVVSQPEPGAEGTGVVEDRTAVAGGTELQIDGRQLLVTSETRLLPPENDNNQPGVTGLNAIAAGAFVQYRGWWRPDGRVQVDELSAWPNPLGEKEKSLYARYEPEMIMPKAGPNPSPVLQIDKNRYLVLNDHDLQLYLDEVGMKLVPAYLRDPQAAARFGYHFWFSVATQARARASAYPGGAIVVHSGLVQLAENEAQLAFVLAHEIAHVTQEHAWREYLYQRKKLLFLRWSTAGLGYIVESAIRKGYERDLEDQADRVALRYMVEAGYDPREGVKMLEQLEKKQEGLSALLWETHHGYGAREKALLRELEHYSAAGLDYAQLTRNTPRFALLRAKMPTATIKAVE